MHDALKGIRVLDFGRYIAGPWCAALLGDLGADVIRIDKIGGSEDRDVLPVGDGYDGALYMQMNRNKRSMTLAPSGPEREAILTQLIASADVVVANMPDTALKTLGLDYERLQEIKPAIVLTTVSAFGHEGPFAAKTGFDVVAQAMSGAMHLTGHEGEPMRSAVSWVDYGTATLCAFGTLAAIMERNTSGKGQHVRGSLLATAMATSNAYLIEQAMTGSNRSGIGNRSQVAAPADMFRAKDGYIVMQAIGGSMFRRWAQLVGAEELLEDERYGSDESRAGCGERISEIMQIWCEQRSVTEALAELEESRLPAAPVLTPQQTLDHPQTQEGNMLSNAFKDRNGQTIPLANTPVSLSRNAGEIRTPAPDNGAHTDEILGELGFGEHDITRFRNADAI